MEPKFIKKFKEVIREQIAQNNRIHIDGFGEFQKVHISQSQKKLQDGQIVIEPPRDIIDFKPEITQQNDDR